ncbi:MAG: helix-turn-helix domain-containing protein [Nitrospira sp.]|nr:helix-turn-helix domain-containing protein [Nitrospira sp.]MDH5194438.1 helix-turn-helix domain-containing protein [Nitrospira sp.]
MLAALSDAKGSRTEAAKRLGVSRATLYRRLVELNIQPR